MEQRPSENVMKALGKVAMDVGTLRNLDAEEIKEALEDSVNRNVITIVEKFTILAFWRAATVAPTASSSSAIPQAPSSGIPPATSQPHPIHISFDGAQFGNFGQAINISAADKGDKHQEKERQEEKKMAVSSMGKGYEIATIRSESKPKNRKAGTHEISCNDRFTGVAKQVMEAYNKQIPTMGNNNESWVLREMNLQTFSNDVWKNFCEDNKILPNSKNISPNQRTERENNLKELIGECGQDAKLEAVVMKGI